MGVDLQSRRDEEVELLAGDILLHVRNRRVVRFDLKLEHVAKVNVFVVQVVPEAFHNANIEDGLIKWEARVKFWAFAAMAELVDALDSGSSRGNSVKVRVFLAANLKKKYQEKSG